jgi:hypothetical protein
MNEGHMNEKEGMCNFYMSTALRYGKVEIKPGVMLYSAAGLEAESLKDKEGRGWKADNDFYIVKGKVFFDLYGPNNLADILEDEPGFVLPVTWKGVT